MKNKKRYPTYKETVQIRFEEKIKQEKYKMYQEIERVKEIAQGVAEWLKLDKQDIFNSMGLYRFKQSITDLNK